MNTPGLNHIILTVSDHEQSRAFYGDLLGFEIQGFTSHAGNVFYYFVTGGVSIWFRMHEQRKDTGRSVSIITQRRLRGRN